MDKFSIVDPDINGIRRVLKITNDFYSEHGDSSCNNKSIDRNSSNVLVVSKLNPNVKEFSSRQINSSFYDKRKIEGSPGVNVSVSNEINSSTQNNCSKTFVNSVQSNVSVVTPLTKVIENLHDVSIDNKNKLQTVPKNTIRLKKIFIKTAKSDSPVHNLERNVAIANVMRLCTKEAPTENFQQKLLSPDYFMTSKNDLEATQAWKENPGQFNCEDVLVKTWLEEEEANRIKNSIVKVTEWLEMPKNSDVRSGLMKEAEKVTSPQAPVLGPITFKKKITSSKSCPPLPVSNAPESPHTIKKHVPSKLAEDLMQKYKENQKTVIASDIWTKLEKELIKRDKQILESNRKTQHTK